MSFTSGPTTLEKLLWCVLAVLLAAFLWVFISPPPTASSSWPLSPQLLHHLGSLVAEDSPESAAVALQHAFEYHNGRKALTINLVLGEDDTLGHRIVGHISRALFGSESSDRVVYLEGKTEKEVSGKVFRTLKQWSLAVFVVDVDSSVPSNYEFLTSAMNENFPFLDYSLPGSLDRGLRVSTSDAIFLFLTKVPQGTATTEQGVKGYLKTRGWADRVCQRIDYTIPVV